MRILLLALAVALTGCVANNICAKEQECDTKLNSDDPGVCVEAYNREINKLRANSEPECQTLADAILSLDACRASLDCDNFQEADLGQKCDKEQNAFNDARDATVSRGDDRCSSFN